MRPVGWREETAAALEAWIAAEGGAGRAPRWHCLGRAVRTDDAGGWAVDVRGSELGPDQLDGLKLSGPDPNTVERSGFSVSDATQDGSLLTFRVAAFADLSGPHLWLLKQPPTFLLEALRDGLAALGDAPLAASLAAGSIGGRSAPAIDPPGFHPAQADAYRACLGSGVRLVWGPPGTGKTTVLKRAVGDLIGGGERVLLVSATNIAVDNALLGVIRERRHGRGDLVRVGPPQLREVAEDPDVSLPLLVRERLSDAAGRCRGIEGELVALRDRAERLAALESALSGFDAAAYFAAQKLLRTPGGDVASAEARMGAARRRAEELELEGRRTVQEVEEARRRVAFAEKSERAWQEVDAIRREQQRFRQAAERHKAQVLLAEQQCHELREELRGLEGKVVRRRTKKRREALQQRVQEAEQQVARAREAAVEARTTADAAIARSDERIVLLEANIPCPRDQIRRFRESLVEAESAARTAGDRCVSARAEAERAETALARAQEAADLTDRADREGRPARHAEAERLRPQVAADAARRARLERQHGQAQEEYERLARNAEAEVVKGSKLVATTLARFRTKKAVLEGPYDVVLVDEAGTATLPEVLLAAGKAQRGVVLLGDFMQLGAVTPPELRGLERPDVKRWLLPDVFEHCGITDPDEARRHPACVTLVEQHRFGPAVMRLANTLAYGGVLQAGNRPPPADPDDDPEIVVVDTDGLYGLAHARLVGRRSGWWPAGALIARALIDLHRDRGEATGVVTPYTAQSAATLEALRDVEGSGPPLAEVGTAHRFQGREFPVVVFDTVEGENGRDLWMACAHRRPGASHWERSGLRLFNVAVTRVQTRLYVIASGRRMSRAPEGTALAELHAMVGTPGVRVLHARHLVTPPAEFHEDMGGFGRELAEVLGRHVQVDAIDGEETFFAGFEEHIRSARHTLWVWAPWVATRLGSLLPELEAAARRGVRVTVFTRDDTDNLQRKPQNQRLLQELRSVVHTLVPMNMMHQKIAVIDDQTVLLGSLNPLSQRWTREVMLTLRGAHFARRLLEHEHAEDFASPPRCGRCGGDEIEIRRHRDDSWWWRCYATACKTPASGRHTNAWKRRIQLSRPR